MRIVVAGDVLVHRLEVPAAEDRSAEAAWRSGPRLRTVSVPGGALLLARTIQELTGAPVATYRDLPPREEAVHACHTVAFAPGKGARALRVQTFRGFAGSGVGVPLGAIADDGDADIVVLHDAGAAFRRHPEAWPRSIQPGSRTTVVLRMAGPVATGPLWGRVRTGNLVAVVDADDLRAQGVNVSRRLSWERTATDVTRQLEASPILASLAAARALVVRFGFEGALLLAHDGDRRVARLWFDKARGEGELREECPGAVPGCGSAFVGSIAAAVAAGRDVGAGIEDGLIRARRLLRRGFGADPDHLDLTLPGVAPDAADRIAQVAVPLGEDAGYWRILSELARERLEEVAQHTVVHGSATALEDVPVGRFGALRTVDRSEIESFRSIRNLMQEYIATESPGRPLSIAVFGPPGSGKSFGVTEVAKGVAPGKVEKIEFNVSQFRGPADLALALHRVRDVALGSAIPLVFFDEFDSWHEGLLGWLKAFLAPMQDGVFRDGGSVHPIGKSIFVFAGGTSATFHGFSREGASAADRAAFAGAKGPDFVSRLRGTIDILGPNPVDADETVHVLRRAMVLRSILERRARSIMDSRGTLRIDPGVVRALLAAPDYKHGARSMEAVVAMSALAGQERFNPSSLPPRALLDLHVDADAFLKLVRRDELFFGMRERIAEGVHEAYRTSQAGVKAADDPAMQPWAALSEDLKASNRAQADHMPVKLAHIGCNFAPLTGRAAPPLQLTEAEVERLAELEHERWVDERIRAGWTLGPRDPARKVSPYLVPYCDLSDEVREWDRQPVRRLPDAMARAGFEVYRLA